MKESKTLNWILFIINIICYLTNVYLYIDEFVNGAFTMLFLGIIQLIIFLILLSNNYDFKISKYHSLYWKSIKYYFILFIIVLILGNMNLFNKNVQYIFIRIFFLTPMLIALYHVWCTYKVLKK